MVRTLAYRRSRCVRFVEPQDRVSWLDGHGRALEFCHGVPETVWLDHRKAGVLRPDRHDPKLNRGYPALDHPDGFVGDPAPLATPASQGPGERAIPVVRPPLLAGRVYRDLAELNALPGGREGVGREVPDTTPQAPRGRFERDEQTPWTP